MNEAFLEPFATALFTALQDDTDPATAGLLALVYDAATDIKPRIYPRRPDAATKSFVVIDYPFGGRDPAYVHGANGRPVAYWLRLQASAWTEDKHDSLIVGDALIQALDGRDIVVSDAWGTVRLFMRGGPWPLPDTISEVRMYGLIARYEILLLK